ncbi:MAG: hypothetical protein JHC33_01060 [Ignisphaera sp.]|nr:hypothetical protein [Ignisphaera sp.]
MSKLSLLEFVRLDAIDLDNIILEAYNPDDPFGGSPEMNRFDRQKQKIELDTTKQMGSEIAKALKAFIDTEIHALKLDEIAIQDGGLNVTLTKPNKPTLLIMKLFKGIEKKAAELRNLYPTAYAKFEAPIEAGGFGRNLRDIVLKLAANK